MAILLKCNKCDNEFNNGITNFTFTDLRTAEPTQDKGVYVIRVAKRGRPVKRTLQELEGIADVIDWNLVKKYVFSRLHRLLKINSCHVIYIGSAGTSESSKNTLKGRYTELCI